MAGLYGKAEQTEKMIYVFIDLGNPVRRKNIINRNREDKEKVPLEKDIDVEQTNKNEIKDKTLFEKVEYDADKDEPF